MNRLTWLIVTSVVLGFLVAVLIAFGR